MVPGSSAESVGVTARRCFEFDDEDDWPEPGITVATKARMATTNRESTRMPHFTRGMGSRLAASQREIDLHRRFNLGWLAVEEKRFELPLLDRSPAKGAGSCEPEKASHGVRRPLWDRETNDRPGILFLLSFLLSSSGYSGYGGACSLDERFLL